MFDELEQLTRREELFRLLGHYAEAGAADREAWQARLAELVGAGPRDLVRLHGELLAFDWVEQDTGAAACRYRVTATGLRAFRQALAERQPV